MKAYGKEIPLSEMPPIDLMLVGSVALHKDGRRIGKGEGYADREYAIIRELGNPPIPVIGTVHSTQVVEDEFEIGPYDLTVDFIVTEQGILETNSPYEKPTGIQWELVTEEEMETMPVLQDIWNLTKKDGRR
jgi:5-formyltetrahydrofolate cyclo-ligase